MSKAEKKNKEEAYIGREPVKKRENILPPGVNSILLWDHAETQKVFLKNLENVKNFPHFESRFSDISIMVMTLATTIRFIMIMVSVGEVLLFFVCVCLYVINVMVMGMLMHLFSGVGMKGDSGNFGNGVLLIGGYL